MEASKPLNKRIHNAKFQIGKSKYEEAKLQKLIQIRVSASAFEMDGSLKNHYTRQYKMKSKYKEAKLHLICIKN